jgi:uncharacterized membrane protein
MELRVSLQEHQVEALVEIVTEIRDNYVTKAYLDERLSRYATKEDLERVRQDTRNWVITVGISLAALQFAVQYAFFQLYLHVR